MRAHTRTHTHTHACTHARTHARTHTQPAGEDIGDETRNFIFWMGGTGFLNFCLSYSIWANYGSPR